MTFLKQQKPRFICFGTKCYETCPFKMIRIQWIQSTLRVKRSFTMGIIQENTSYGDSKTRSCSYIKKYIGDKGIMKGFGLPNNITR